MTPEHPARGGFAALDSCVHCGFCLQACPTFLATGDEADSPRGRIELMRALERGELTADDPAVTTHLDRCLGCRGCEPVCPSGVGYGHGLEAARAVLAERRGVPTIARLALAALTSSHVGPAVYAAARLARATGVPGLLSGTGRVRFAMGMLAATRPTVGRPIGKAVKQPTPSVRPPDRPPAQLFRGCVMSGLFSHVHDATRRALECNGYAVMSPAAQACCGALHAHAGLRAEAQALARANVAAFAGDAPIVVNSAGCGAIMKEYDDLLPDDPGAAAFASRVRDVSEVLAERGPAPGAPLDLRVAYHPPCHLLHAQRVAEPPLQLLRAIPGLDVVMVTEGAGQCCGSAGLFTLVEPAMSRAVLAPQLARLDALHADAVATGNPGCAMQLGAGFLAAGVKTPVVHPVELLDASYQALPA